MTHAILNYVRPHAKRIFSLFGSMLSFFGIVFVSWRLYLDRFLIDFNHIDENQFYLLVVFAVVIAVANVMLAFGWLNLLELYDVYVSHKWAIVAYGVSQLAKYVPGNIFNMVSRQAIGMAAGLPAWPLLKSAAWELGLITVAGGIVGLLALPLAYPDIPMLVGIFVSLSCLLIAFVVFNLFIGRAAAVAFFWQISFFVCSGLIYVCILRLVTPSYLVGDLDWLLTLGACVLAWVIGLITPGAPAGVGVREMVLLFLLGGKIAQGDLLLAVVLGRGVTLIGDILFFIVASAMNMRLTFPLKNESLRS